MGKRSELRRIQRNADKKKKSNNSTMPVNVMYGSQTKVQENFGLSVQELKVYLERMERSMKADFEENYQKKLYKAEDYITVGYLCVVMFAINNSRKKHEHTKDLIQRMLENLNEAQNYVNEIGIDKAYQKAKEMFDINIEFDSVDINKEFGITEGGA